VFARLTSLLALLAILTAALPAAAQTLDPRTLESLQRRLGAGSGSLPLPTAPGGASDSGAAAGEPATLPGAQVDTKEEQEVRRARAQRELQQLYEPSPVERDYRRRVGDPALRQFGYDLLQSGGAPTGVRTGAIGEDYVLGIGDEISVSFRGATNSAYVARVDRDGRIVIGELKPLPAAGRTLGAVRSDIAAETRRTLLATEAYVTVGEVRQVSVFVGGEVMRPGQYALTSLTDVATAIARAGGVRRSGSLRAIRLVRASGASLTVDLYGFLGIGTPAAIRLQDGDRIVVPVIGPTIAVTGSVPRPGIFELRGATTAGAAAALAGGALRQRGAQVVIGRIQPDGGETFIRASLPGTAVIGGDAVQVLGGSPGGAAERVRLDGNVDNPGWRPLAAAASVADLVGRPEDLRPDTYQLAAALIRRDPDTGARVVELVNLAQELRRISTTRLRSEDRLFLFSQSDIAFLNSGAVRRIILGDSNPLHCPALQNLERLVRDTQSLRFNAATRGRFSFGGSDGEGDATAAAAALAAGSRDQAESIAQSKPEDDLLGRSAALGREARGAPTIAAVRADGAGESRENNRLCPATFDSEPDLLPILIENSVSVGGAIRRPGAFPVAGQISARDLSLVAEGLVGGSYDLILDINRGRDAATERLAVDPAGNILRTALLQPGDDVRFSAQNRIFEGAGVLLSGEVRRPGLYAVRKGEKLSELIERAGGMTDLGYAYGTVFTRRSVKSAQEQGFRRTAREMNNGLLAIAARARDGQSMDLAGAATLIRALATTEAPGRLVLEADPRVLALRPDLDTVLEGGDAVFVPKRPNMVLVLGDVQNPGALQFVDGKSWQSYLAEAGGTLKTADAKRVFMVLPNGAAQPLDRGGRSVPVPPGTTLIVPKNIDPLYKLSIVRDITSIVAQLATAIGTVAILATN